MLESIWLHGNQWYFQWFDEDSMVKNAGFVVSAQSSNQETTDDFVARVTLN